MPVWHTTQRVYPGRFSRKIGWTCVLKNSKSSEGTLDKEGGCWAKNAATTQKAIVIIACSCSGILTPCSAITGLHFAGSPDVSLRLETCLMIEITSGPVRLRRHVASDLDEIHRWQNDPELLFLNSETEF